MRARISPTHITTSGAFSLFFFFVLHHRGVGGGRPTCGASFCPPLSVWLSRTQARTHAVFGVVVETQQVRGGGGTAVIPEESSGFWRRGSSSEQVRPQTWMAVFPSLLIHFLLKIAQICQFEASVLVSHTQAALGSLLFVRLFVVSG